jgi:hypothetical protein
MTSREPPTDLELMLYADGELDEARIVVVEAWLAADRGARSKLAALDLVGSVLRERAHEPPAIDVADAVMARIAAAPAKPERPDLAARAANDNARIFYALAAVVMGVAAAFLLWTRSPTHHGPVARNAAAHHAGARHADAHNPGSVPEVPGTEPDSVDIVEPEPEHGVEVSAVHFGSANGAVFYVPSGGPASSTTAVVWLSDEEQAAAGEPE